MAKRKKKTKKKKSGATFLTSVREWEHWPAAGKCAIVTLWLLGIGGVVTGYIFGVPKLEAAVADHARMTQTEAIPVVFVDAPLWTENDLQALLAAIVQSEVGADPFARFDLMAARDALLATGCFESVEQVRRTGAETIEVDAKFLQPYAQIREGDRIRLLDARARLLPAWVKAGDPSQFVTITGARFDPPTQIGAAWEGADISAALRLLHMINRQAWRAQIVELDVTGYTNGQPLVLVTNSNARIIWRSAPGEERGGEVPADDKIARLSYLYEQSGRIDGHHQGELDLTDPRGVFAR